MISVHLNDRAASYIDLKEIRDSSNDGCLVGTSENGELVFIPKQSILYVEVEQD